MQHPDQVPLEHFNVTLLVATLKINEVDGSQISCDFFKWLHWLKLAKDRVLKPFDVDDTPIFRATSYISSFRRELLRNLSPTAYKIMSVFLVPEGRLEGERFRRTWFGSSPAS